MGQRDRQFATYLIAALFLASQTGAQWNDEEEQKDCAVKKSCQPFEVLTTIPNCQCTDIVPVYYAGAPTSGSCLTQVAKGNCDQPWMKKSATDEVSSGYCDISCGRCDCCKTYADMLPAVGSSFFLQMVDAAGLKANLTSPAYSFTILAPSNAAVDEYLAASELTFTSALANLSLLRQIVSYHILPNVPVIDAWWSTPFLLPETVLSTLLGPTATIIVDAKGALNGKAMTQEDYPTCKGNVIPIDAVLQPPNFAAGTMIRADPSSTETAATPTKTVTPAPIAAKRAADAPQQVRNIASSSVSQP